MSREGRGRGEGGMGFRVGALGVGALGVGVLGVGVLGVGVLGMGVLDAHTCERPMQSKDSKEAAGELE